MQHHKKRSNFGLLNCKTEMAPLEMENQFVYKCLLNDPLLMKMSTYPITKRHTIYHVLYVEWP